MRILITGAGGLVGGRLSALLSADHDVVGVFRRKAAAHGVRALQLDLATRAAVVEAFKKERPEVVIHCAALADPELCEVDPERASLENETVSRLVAQSCASIGARLIALSTDLVFGGETAFSTETSLPAPLSVYARTKLGGEAAVLRESLDSVVLRLALVCGQGVGARLTASEGIASRLRRREVVTLFEDEWRTPVDADSVAAAVRAVLSRRDASGVFHIGGGERINRVELGERVAAVQGLDASLVRRALRASHAGAPRPRDVSLDISRARQELNWTPQSLDAALRGDRSTSAVP